MSFTKRDIVTMAFEEVGLAGYVFDLQPQQLDGALRRLDAMMATWNGKGIRIGYPLPASQSDSDLDEVLGVGDDAHEAMALNLAVRIAPSYGKTVSPDTKAAAKSGFNQLLAQHAKPIEAQLDASAVPAGAGNRKQRNTYLSRAGDRLTAGPDSVLNLR